MDSALAKKYSKASDYPVIAKAAIEKMVSLQPEQVFSDDGIMQKGVIVRHLCLPGCRKDSEEVIEYIFKTYGDKVKLSIMSQYTPMPQCAEYPEINCKIKSEDYERIIDYCLSIGIQDAYIQEGDAAEESFIPEFT